MTLQDIKYLVALKKYKHFGQAAKHCFVSQPTLSMQIKKMEEFLQVTLVERHNKQVLLTPIGEKIIQIGQNMLTEYNDILNLAHQVQDPYSGTLHIGIIPTIAPYFLPTILPQITAAFPKLRLFLREEQTSVITQKLIEGQLDLVILALPLQNTHIVSYPLFEEEFLLAVSVQHPLAQKKTINAATLKKEKLLLLEDGHCLRNQSLEFCSTIGHNEYEEFRATSLETLRYMVQANVGITLMPSMACNRDYQNICYIPFAKPKPQRTIGLCWRKNSPQEELFKQISQTIKH